MPSADRGDTDVRRENVEMDFVSAAQSIVDELTKSSAWLVLVAVGTALGVVVKVVKPMATLAMWQVKRRSAAASAAMQAKTHVSSFTDAEITQAVVNYIEPDASNVDPANEDDLRDFAFVREPVFAAIDRSLDSPDKVHVLVLADSGMGKTTLLLNFYQRELSRPKKRRREVALVPLGRADATDQIKAVANKRSTILLLDALDEDTHAIADHSKRLQQLMVLAADFKAVLITCRTQFFTSDAALPSATGISRVSPKRAGSSGSHHFKKIYLLPFSTAQVRSYIAKTIPWYRTKSRRRASALVERIPELTVRPMLLALLPDLMQREDNLREVWDLYAFMVDSWLARESHWINPEELLTISQKVAVEVFLGRRKRGSERLKVNELAELVARSTSNIETWKLTTRSLLNRDAVGSYKFAHRSIMEFLFVRALIVGEDRCANVQWTDMMCTLFLSWGRSAVSDEEPGHSRARLLLEGDGLSKTGIFPLVDTYQPASRIDSQWAKRALGQSNLMRERAGVPHRWRKWTSRLLRRQDVVRVYDFSEGVVWQFICTRELAEFNLYRVGRHEGRSQDRADEVWERPTLVEFRSLVETLLAHDSHLLDERELYWLADEDAQSLSMARLRNSKIEPEAQSEQPNGASLIASAPLGGTNDLVLDVYEVPKVQRVMAGQRSVPAPVAQQVSTLRGDAQLQWGRDKLNPSSTREWGLRTVGDHWAPPAVARPAPSRRDNRRADRDIG